jgi:hypothetical protein
MRGLGESRDKGCQPQVESLLPGAFGHDTFQAGIKESREDSLHLPYYLQHMIRQTARHAHIYPRAC